MSKFVKLSFVLSFILAMSAIAFGQSTVTGAIGGVVTNPNKEVVPNAAVAARNTETNKEDNATTDDQGRFNVANLQPGIYSVTINGSGFSPYTQEKVVVEIGRETTLNAALSIGPVSGGTVEITSEAPVINTSQQDFSSNINQTSINELPINGRRWSNFALLTPGTVPDGKPALDEVVASSASVHLEQMSHDQWWMGIQAGGKDFHLWFTLEDGRLCVRLSDQDDENAEWEGDNRKRPLPAAES